MFTKEKLEGLYIDLFNRSLELSKAPPKAAEPTFLAPVKKKGRHRTGADQQHPGKFDDSELHQHRSFFLTGTQKHPKYPDWISAEEIGAPYRQKADFVKKHIMNYATSRGKDLPNNKARDLVLRNGGYFEGIKSIVDGFKLPCFVDEELGGPRRVVPDGGREAGLEELLVSPQPSRKSSGSQGGLVRPSTPQSSPSSSNSRKTFQAPTGHSRSNVEKNLG